MSHVEGSQGVVEGLGRQLLLLLIRSLGWGLLSAGVTRLACEVLGRGEVSSMRALGLLPLKVSGFADSGGCGAHSWVADGGGGYGYSIQG